MKFTCHWPLATIHSPLSQGNLHQGTNPGAYAPRLAPLARLATTMTTLAAYNPRRPDRPPTFVTPEPDYSGWAWLLVMLAGIALLIRTAYYR